VLNYVCVIALAKSGEYVEGVVARDEETGNEIEIRGKSLVNATGPYTDVVRRLDDPEARAMIRPSQGVHIVLERAFLPGDSAIMVPHTDDGRVLFAIPWHGRVIVGTTDTPIEDIPYDPYPLDEEIEFLLEHAARYLEKDPKREDILSTFAGIRPLVSLSTGANENTAAISRDHTIHISPSGLVTIAGGKWTTYRKMAEDTIDQAATMAGLEEKPSVTKALRIHGYQQDAARYGELALYGSDAPAVQDLLRANEGYDAPLHVDSPVRAGEVVWAARHEMARTVEDFLSRRTRALLLDAKTATEMAPRVAAILAAELGRDEDWAREQVLAFETLAEGYLPR